MHACVCRGQKGWGLNVAFWIHRIEAVLAMLHVFIIHFLIAHLRRSAFPMDNAMFTGDADLEHAEKERQPWMARLRGEGRLKERLSGPAPAVSRVISYVVGFCAMGFGLYILVGGLLNARLVSW